MSEKSSPAKLPGAPTRRQVIAGVAAACTLAASRAWAAPAQATTMAEQESTGADRLRTYLRQEVDFNATPQRIYGILLDSKQFGACSGEPAEISPDAGGAFSMFGGKIVGRNIELLPNQRVVQAWRAANWEPGLYTVVKFVFKDKGPQTTVVLDHTGFPEGAFGHLSEGWKSHYWEPLKKYLS